MSDVRLLYVTIENIESARELAHMLVDRKLIACANILPQMESVYRWEGKIKNSAEVALILKTEKRLVQKTIDAVIGIHPYEKPCVLEIPIESGAKGYMDWLKSEVS